MDKWFRLLAEERASVAGLRKSMSDLLDKGPQKDGSPYKDEDDEKPRLKGKKNRNQVSAPPGAPGGGIGPALEESDIEEARKNTFRNRIKTYTKDRDELLNVGGQQNSAPYTQKMGKHVTFDKQVNNIDEEVEPESFEKNETLEPHFWQNDTLNPKIARRLLRISDDFIKGLDVPVEVEDIRFTGSLANYNWSRYSDVDLHLVVDFSKIDPDTELVKAFFDAVRMRWNDVHDIKIYGYEVEIYVENVGDEHRSSGIYSITNNEWVVRPDSSDVHFSFSVARAKSDDILSQINAIGRFVDEKPRDALRAIERLKSKIRNMRRAGLEKPAQEFSAENIAFKILRREESLQMLNDMKYNAYDKIMSMELS